MVRLFENNVNDVGWPETLELDFDRIQEWKRELLEDLLLRTQELFSKQNRTPSGAVLSEDPVYLLLKKRRLDELGNEFEAATLRGTKVESKFSAFAKYHWAIHLGTYLQVHKEFERDDK